MATTHVGRRWGRSQDDKQKLHDYVKGSDLAMSCQMMRFAVKVRRDRGSGGIRRRNSPVDPKLVRFGRRSRDAERSSALADPLTSIRTSASATMQALSMTARPCRAGNSARLQAKPRVAAASRTQRLRCQAAIAPPAGATANRLTAAMKSAADRGQCVKRRLWPASCVRRVSGANPICLLLDSQSRTHSLHLRRRPGSRYDKKGPSHPR